jgi:antitoxin FitA
MSWLGVALTYAAHVFYAFCMGAMVQIRNIPDALHRRLKSRAALADMSLSEYLLREIRQVAERPTLDELRARLRSRTEAVPSVAPAEAVRTECGRV